MNNVAWWLIGLLVGSVGTFFGGLQFLAVVVALAVFVPVAYHLVNRKVSGLIEAVNSR